MKGESIVEKIVEMTTAAFALAREPYDPLNIKFGKYSPIYLAPTGNVKDMMAPFRGAKRVLAVGGAGAFGFEGAINDASVVDMFDCNALQKCFFEIVKASIMVLSYEDFMRFFTLETQRERMTYGELRNLVSPVLFMLIEEFLPFEVRFLYNQLYKSFDSVDMIHSSLYRYAHALYRKYLTRFASMYDEESYYKLQEKLRKKLCTINYEEASLVDLPKKFDGPYDLIVLGNIFQYYQDIAGLNTPYAVNTFVKKELSKLLSEDGVIQVNYGFEVATTILKEKLGLPYNRTKSNSSLEAQMIRKFFAKSDINLALLEKGGYNFTFFEGVESYEDGPTENMCLTYKPQAKKK